MKRRTGLKGFVLCHPQPLKSASLAQSRYKLRFEASVSPENSTEEEIEMKSSSELSQNNEEEESYGREEQLIQNGTFCLIQRADQERMIEFKEDDSINYGRGFNFQEIKLKNMKNCPFHSTFKIMVTNSEKRKGKDGKPAGQLCHLELVEPSSVMSKSIDLLKKDLSISEKYSSGSPDGNISRDNRSINDDGKSQPLGATDIASLREQGISGREILDQLISGHKTFNQKTEFSQEKYLKKKEKLYGDTLMVLKPSLDLIADYYFKRDPSKIMNLRIDSLSQMLSYANVHANGKFMIYETGCSGLLVASVLQRLGGYGIALHVHTGSTPQRQALYYMNFRKEELEPLKSLDVFYLIRPTQSFEPKSSVTIGENSINSESSEPTEPESKKIKLSEESLVPTEEASRQGDGADLDDKNDEEKTVEGVPSLLSKFVSINRLENERSALLLQTTEFDGLLICAKEHPLSIAQRLLPHLASSAPFVIFCQYAEPLIECYTWIKDFNMGVNLNLVDNWFRTIQVEVERTHPEINMSSSGGYLLFGTSVAAGST